MLQNLPPQRWETTAARQLVASKLGLPYADVMQDWPWEVASPEHLDDYRQLYASASDDERVVLMEMMLQATTDQEEPAALEHAWGPVKGLLDQNPALHAWTVHDWCCWGASAQAGFEITPYLRSWWATHFALPA
ncbi:hypothetical protein I2I05_21630 [Hymenobacter sp. BT683]|uniref:Gluconate 2-dehydrogenase subunit 3 family protein n=1 Tax=Hymenobacter jeongseonensis TaxID=2791027 RepID=A0ABS0INS3_9BACT|nr:hypothetical protein [Hymenobacter jeongseonensis]MBF9240006.1 hypothetical protein [Hymenobacter jeongseonensis]